jgi:transcriptional regulator with XRE-family HTH domain
MRITHREPAKTAWGKAFEVLRERVEARKRKSGDLKGYSQYQLCKDADMAQSQYRKLLQEGVKGPQLQTMQKLLNAMEFTWKDWADTYKPMLVDQDLPTSKKKKKHARGIPMVQSAVASKGGG